MPNVFLPNFNKPTHVSPTIYSGLNYEKPISKRKACKYRISLRGPNLSNNFVTPTQKQTNDMSKFKAATKPKLFSYSEIVLWMS